MTAGIALQEAGVETMSNVSEQVTDPARPAKSDAFTPWYTVLTGAFFLLLWTDQDLDRIFNLYILLVPILAICAFIWLATLLTGLAVNAFKRRWRRVLSIAVAPIIAWSFFSALGPLGVTTQRIRLEWGKSDYLAEVGALPASDDGIRLKTWNWGSTGGVAVPNFFWTLVYDDSDQIVLPPSSWSAVWVRKTGQTGSPLYSVVHNRRDGKDYYVSVKRLDGHFYVVEELYP
jgi:hypothetical protein